jgi:predicted metal-dependent hydrolase
MSQTNTIIKTITDLEISQLPPPPEEWFEYEYLDALEKAEMEKALEIENGRYAIYIDLKIRFFKVQKGKGKWKDCTFVSEIIGGGFDGESKTISVRNRTFRESVILQIYYDKEALYRYSQEMVECCYCGRELTDEISKRNGMGSTCRDKYPPIKRYNFRGEEVEEQEAEDERALELEIKMNKYKSQRIKFDLKTEVINNKMKKEIEAYELKNLKECNGSSVFGVCSIRERYEKNAYQRKRIFEKKWGYSI